MDLTKKHCVPCEGNMPPMPFVDEDGIIEFVKVYPLSEVPDMGEIIKYLEGV